MPKLEISFTFGKTTLIRRLLVIAMVNHNESSDFLKLNLTFCLTILVLHIYDLGLLRWSFVAYIIEPIYNQKQSLQSLHYFTAKELCSCCVGLYEETLTLLSYIIWYHRFMKMPLKIQCYVLKKKWKEHFFARVEQPRS